MTRKKLAVALTLAAAVGAAAFVEAGPASAATLGVVVIQVAPADLNNQEAGRAQALSGCQRRYSETRSVEFRSASMQDFPETGQTLALQDWACLDTP